MWKVPHERETCKIDTEPEIISPGQRHKFVNNFKFYADASVGQEKIINTKKVKQTKNKST